MTQRARPARGHEARRLEDRLTRLARVAADLGRAEDVQTVTDIVISQAADAVGATVASLSMVIDDDTIALVGMRGGKDGAPDRWATFSRHLPTPAGDVVRTGELLVLTGREAIQARYPDLETSDRGRALDGGTPPEHGRAHARGGDAVVPGEP